MRVTVTIKGERYTMKRGEVYGPYGERDPVMSALARLYRATWRPAYGDPQAYAGARMAQSRGGEVEVIHEKEDDPPTGKMRWH